MQSAPHQEINKSGRHELVDAVGNTPLLRLTSRDIKLPDGVEIYAKAEHLNPGGSVKDRAALAMILDGERSGKLTKDKTILDATSGNTGIAYAMIAASRGYKVALCLPKNASAERKDILRSYGAEIFETDPTEQTDGAQRLAKKLVQDFPEKYFYPDQYNNDANWRAHYDGTGVEIIDQTGGRITHFVAALGTTGTFTGVARRLKSYNPAIKAISVQPDSPLHGLEGVKHLKSAMVPGIYDELLSDASIEVATDDALETAAELGTRQGLLVGPSSGANVFAAFQVASSLPETSVVVTILCDRGERYFSHAVRKEPALR